MSVAGNRIPVYGLAWNGKAGRRCHCHRRRGVNFFPFLVVRVLVHLAQQALVLLVVAVPDLGRKHGRQAVIAVVVVVVVVVVFVFVVRLAVAFVPLFEFQFVDVVVVVVVVVLVLMLVVAPEIERRVAVGRQLVGQMMGDKNEDRRQPVGRSRKRRVLRDGHECPKDQGSESLGQGLDAVDGPQGFPDRVRFDDAGHQTGQARIDQVPQHREPHAEKELPGLVRRPQHQALQAETDQADPDGGLFSQQRDQEPDQHRLGDHGGQSECRHEFPEDLRRHVKVLDGVEGEGGNDGPQARVVEKGDLSHLAQERVVQDQPDRVPGIPRDRIGHLQQALLGGRCEGDGRRRRRRFVAIERTECRCRCRCRYRFRQDHVNVEQIQDRQHQRARKDVPGLAPGQVSPRHGTDRKAQAKGGQGQPVGGDALVAFPHRIGNVGKDQRKGRRKQSRQAQEDHKEGNGQGRQNDGIEGSTGAFWLRDAVNDAVNDAVTVDGAASAAL
mmetsp:Transcript_15430/g.42786  ORF Transcript_15430/g.42786 Transcript_15430/m.42786 type:complete len:497 (-) Transcript_15430:732-2222(-)